MFFQQEPQSLRHPGFWRLNSVLATFFGFLSFNSRLYLGEPAGRSLIIAVATVLTSLSIGGLLRFVYITRFSKSSLGVRSLLVVGLLSLAAAAVHASSIACVTHVLNRSTAMHWHFSQWATHERFYLLLLIVWPMYFGWSLGYFWVRAEFRVLEQGKLNAEAKTESQRMELQLLRFQLDPHFLFNTLNGIVSEIPSDPDAAVRMVAELSTYLKYSLDQRNQMITRLSAELDATSSYLRIQKARFGDRVQTHIESTQSARSTQVPSFILQPLVENAFKHGFSTMPPPWIFELSAITRDDHLVIKVRNQGTLTPSRSPSLTSFGVGLESILGRLEIHYPGRNAFTIEQEGELVVVTLDLEGTPCNV